jgi:hypothetical protein
MEIVDLNDNDPTQMFEITLPWGETVICDNLENLRDQMLFIFGEGEEWKDMVEDWKLTIGFTQMSPAEFKALDEPSYT